MSTNLTPFFSYIDDSESQSQSSREVSQIFQDEQLNDLLLDVDNTTSSNSPLGFRRKQKSSSTPTRLQVGSTPQNIQFQTTPSDRLQLLQRGSQNNKLEQLQRELQQLDGCNSNSDEGSNTNETRNRTVIFRMFKDFSEAENITHPNYFREELLIAKGGFVNIAKRSGFGWVYVATMESMIAAAKSDDRYNDFIVAIASAMFIRSVDINLEEGEEFESAKKTADEKYYETHYKYIVETFVVYQAYYARTNTWPDWDFISKYVYVCVYVRLLLMLHKINV